MIFGAVINEDLKDEILVTVIATGFDHQKEPEQAKGKPQFGLDRDVRPADKPSQIDIVKPKSEGGGLEIPTFLGTVGRSESMVARPKARTGLLTQDDLYGHRRSSFLRQLTKKNPPASASLDRH